MRYVRIFSEEGRVGSSYGTFEDSDCCFSDIEEWYQYTQT
jgi:hypothetical protein